MIITFYVEYQTRWGEELYLMMGNDRFSAVKMDYTLGGVWTTRLTVSDNTRELRYRYMVKEAGEVTRVERCTCHALKLPVGVSRVIVEDFWNDHEENAGSNDIIRRLFDMGASTSVSDKTVPGSIIIEAAVDLPNPRMKPAVAGEAPVLGAWNVRRSLPMQPCGESLWRAVFEMPQAQVPTPFKLICVSKRGEVEWESGDNRWLHHAPQADEVLLMEGLRFRGAGRKKIGTLVDIHALRSDGDMGVGDLGDLKKVIKWAETTGQDVVALNSLADLSVVEGWMPEDVRQRILDNAIDPAYIRSADLGVLADRRLKAQFQQAGMALNRLDEAPIHEVRALKIDFSRAIYDQVSGSVTRSAAYRRFVVENGIWLRPYVSQLILQNVNGPYDTSRWGNYAKYDPQQIERFLKARHRETAFLCWLQMMLRQQLMLAAQYARGKRITLTCDMGTPKHVKLLDPKEPWVNQRFIEHKLRDGDGLVLVPLHDWLLTDGSLVRRMANSPARLPVTIEELIASSDLNARLAALIKGQGTYPQSQQ